MKLAVSLEAFGLPIRAAVMRAAKLGVAGVQIDAAGDFDPRKLGDSGRREVRHLLRGNGLEFAGLRCPLRHGLDVALDLQPRIERIQAAMTLSVELGARLAIVEAGRIPESPDEPRMAILTESLHALGRHGDRIGAMLALETGLESGSTLAGFLARFDTGALGGAFNPGNLLVNGYDPVAELPGLRGRVVYAVAKDARRGAGSRNARDVPLGHGDIDWLQLLGTLGAMEYHGWVVLERDGSPNTDVAAGVEFLRRLV